MDTINLVLKMTENKPKKVYQWITHSNAAPFVSDVESGFIEAATPKAALEDILKKYRHPAGLFSAAILEPSPANPLLARYLSPRAATQHYAKTGLHEWRDDGLYVDGKKVPERQEIYEILRGG